MSTPTSIDTAIRYNYDLTGPNADLAVKNGLADAVWYQSPVPRAAHNYFKRVLMHSTGRLFPDEKSYIPHSEYPKILNKG